MRIQRRVFEKAAADGANAVIVSAAIESELVSMDVDERLLFLEEMGLHETGLTRVIRSGYDLLHLITFFTVGPEGSAGVDGRNRQPGTAGRGRNPHRFRAWVHPRRDHRLRRLYRARMARPARAMPVSYARKARNMS